MKIDCILTAVNEKFRLLVCKNCKGKNTGSSESENHSVFSSNNSFLTRDRNACINMLNIAKYMIYNNKKRPTEFCREENKKNPRKKSKKKLKKKKKIKKLPSPAKEKGGKSVVFTEGNTSSL